MSKQKFVTPVGLVKFPCIANPDKRGKYSIALTFDPNEKSFIDLINQINEAEKEFDKKSRGNPHFKKDFKIENGEKVESGLVLMQFKSSFPIFDDKNTKIFDSKNNPVKIDI